MKKIVIDGRLSGTTTGRYIDKLVEYLHQLKPDYEIIILAKSHRLSFFKQLAPGYSVIETTYKEFTFDEQLGFLKQLNSQQADLVFFPIVQQPVLYRGTVVTAMLDLTTIRFRNPAKNVIIMGIKGQVYKWLTKKVARKSHALIALSKFVKDDVVRYTGVNPAKITVTYAGADSIADKPQAVAGLKNKPFIMYVGRPLPHKNLERLIEAFHLLRNQYPDLYLVLAGKSDPNYERIEKLVQKNKVEQVIFTGFVSEGQLRWLYEHTRAYLFPSLSEGFGLPGLEAMEHGAPVISSNATCLPEIYGSAAHYFDPFDVQAITNAIVEVLSDDALREQLIKRGKTQVKKYSWQAMAKQTLAVFEKALS